jgi:hypothetical protein
MNRKKKVKVARIGFFVGSILTVAGVGISVTDFKQGPPLFVLGMAILGGVIVFCSMDQL